MISNFHFKCLNENWKFFQMFENEMKPSKIKMTTTVFSKGT